MISPYIALMKLRVVELLLVTTLPALFLAAEGVPPLEIAIATLIGGTLAAGAANAFNMIIESDIDQLMGRTSKRPIVNNQITGNSSANFCFSHHNYFTSHILDLHKPARDCFNSERHRFLCFRLHSGP